MLARRHSDTTSGRVGTADRVQGEVTIRTKSLRSRADLSLLLHATPESHLRISGAYFLCHKMEMIALPCGTFSTGISGHARSSHWMLDVPERGLCSQSGCWFQKCLQQDRLLPMRDLQSPHPCGARWWRSAHPSTLAYGRGSWTSSILIASSAAQRAFSSIPEGLCDPPGHPTEKLKAKTITFIGFLSIFNINYISI